MRNVLVWFYKFIGCFLKKSVLSPVKTVFKTVFLLLLHINFKPYLSMLE